MCSQETSLCRSLPLLLAAVLLAATVGPVAAGEGATQHADIAVTASEDDAEENPAGDVQHSSSDLELFYDDGYPPAGNQVVGIRFLRLGPPPGAVITRAYIQFTAKDDSPSTPTKATIRAQAASDPLPFTGSQNNLSSRPLTQTAVLWNPPPWKKDEAGPGQRTPDLAPLLAELLARPGQPPEGPVAFIISGEGIRRAYAFDGKDALAPRLHVEWESPPGSAVAANADESAAATAPEEASSSAAETVNVLIDNLIATADRLLELPLYAVAAILFGTGLVVALTIVVLCRKHQRPWLRRLLLAAITVVVVVAAAWAVDRKTRPLVNEVRELRSKASTDPIGLLDVIAQRTTRRKAFLFDNRAADDALRARFGDVRTIPLIYDEATDVVFIHRDKPIAQAYLVVIDLRYKGLTLHVGTGLDRKTLTSDFALANNCSVAVNGEAGRSPKPDSGLGEWTGNLVDRGRVVLLEDSEDRPFMAFDGRNHAIYSPASAVVREASPDWYNVIWGRHDVLVDGVAATADPRNSQPRTAMAIDGKGERLYLLVVDGRQPGYSMGFTRPDVGHCLAAFGAHDGMLCDEGGSSCIYLRKFGGIADIPSDNRGQERPTYTHFGISLTEAPSVARP